MLGVARIDSYWQTIKPRSCTRRRRGCTVPAPCRSHCACARRTEWRNQAERLLNDIDQWSGKSEREERDYFYQKAVLYTWLAELVPAGSLHAQTMRSFVEFMRRSETDASRRALWFAFVNRLLEMTRGPSRNEVLTAMESRRRRRSPLRETRAHGARAAALKNRGWSSS